MVDWNVNGVDELTKEVDANTASISSLTSTVNSDHDDVVNLEGMKLLKDYFYVNSEDRTYWNAGSNTIATFTVPAG